MHTRSTVALAVVSGAVFCVLAESGSVAQADLITVGRLNSSSRDRAIQFLKNRDVDGARNEVEKTTAADPNSPHPEVVLADLLLQVGNPTMGVSVLEAVAASEPERFDIRFAFCAMALRQRRWFDCWTHIASCEKAPMPKSWSPAHQQLAKSELRSVKARCSEGRKDWMLARKLYQAILKETLHGRSPQTRQQALSGHARALFHLGELNACFESFSTLSSENPAVGPAELMVAQLFDETGELDKAEEWFSKAARKSPRQASIVYARWLIWNNFPEKVDELLANYPRAPEPQPRLPESEYLRILSLRMRREFGRARQILDSLSDQYPDSRSLANQLALVLIESDDAEQRTKALKLAERATRKAPANAEAWATLGWVHLQLGNVQQAQQSLDKAVRGGKLSRDAAFYLGALNSKLGNRLKASEFYSAARNANGPFFYPHLMPTDK